MKVKLMNSTDTKISGFVAVAFPILLAALAVHRAVPFVDDIPGPNGDDWYTYKSLAENVLQQGWTMPMLRGTYAGMAHGFLYIYFVAAVFAVFGVNTAYVYVVQAAMAGTSASLMYLAFRRKLSARAGLALVLALDFFVYADVYRSMAFRLLSENLYLFLCPIMWILLLRSVEEPRRTPLASIAAGFALGLIVLTRPSFIGAAAAVVGMLWLRSLWTTDSIGAAAGITGGLIAGLGIVVLRNAAATGKATFDIVTNTSDWIRIWTLPLPEFLRTLIVRTLLAFGVPELMVSTYRTKPHWIAAWLLASAGLVVAWRCRQAIQFWELLLLAFITCYIGPVILVADIASYGGRMVVVILPSVLVLAARAFDRMRAMPTAS
jgi:hypothetical protein